MEVDDADQLAAVYAAAAELQAHRTAVLPPVPSGPTWTVLVRRLLEAIAKAEHLPLHIHEVPLRDRASLLSGMLGGGGGGGGGSSGSGSAAGHGGVTTTTGLRALTQPLKLRLRSADAGSSGSSGTGTASGDTPRLRDLSGNVVLIEPLATVRAIEEFLMARVLPSGALGAEGTGDGPGAAGTTRRGRQPDPMPTAPVEDEEEGEDAHDEQHSGLMATDTEAAGEGRSADHDDAMDDEEEGQAPPEADDDLSLEYNGRGGSQRRYRHGREGGGGSGGSDARGRLRNDSEVVDVVVPEGGVPSRRGSTSGGPGEGRRRSGRLSSTSGSGGNDAGRPRLRLFANGEPLAPSLMMLQVVERYLLPPGPCRAACRAW
jgi:hypothetical protein